MNETVVGSPDTFINDIFETVETLNELTWLFIVKNLVNCVSI